MMNNRIAIALLLGYSAATASALLRGPLSDRHSRELQWKMVVPPFNRVQVAAQQFFDRQDNGDCASVNGGGYESISCTSDGVYALDADANDNKMEELTFDFDTRNNLAVHMVFTDDEGNSLPIPTCAIQENGESTVDCKFCEPTYGALLAYQVSGSECTNVMDPRAVGYQKLVADMTASTEDHSGTCDGPIGSNLTVSCSNDEVSLAVSAYNDPVYDIVYTDFVQIFPPPALIQIFMTYDTIPYECQITPFSHIDWPCTLCDPGPDDIMISVSQINNGQCTSIWDLWNITSSD